MTAFTSSRADGRSDRQVVFDLTRDAEPDTKFSYQELIKELSHGLSAEVDRTRVYPAVAEANKTLLRERSRYLQVVRDMGYRVIAADEHLPVALNRKGRAQKQLKAGIDLLRKCRTDELSDEQRKLHHGQLLVLGGLHQAVQDSDRRHDRAEALISDLTNRVQKLEQGEQ